MHISLRSVDNIIYPFHTSVISRLVCHHHTMISPLTYEKKKNQVSGWFLNYSIKSKSLQIIKQGVETFCPRTFIVFVTNLVLSWVLWPLTS